MQIVRLPKDPRKLSPEILNKQLHAGKIRLDWADVECSMSRDQLTILLAGLNLSEHSDIIGISTVPPFLQNEMVAIFRAQDEDRARREAQVVENPRGATPKVWTPPGEEVDPDITAIKKVRARQDIAELVSQNAGGLVPLFPASFMLPDHQAIHLIGAPRAEDLTIPVLPDLHEALTGKQEENARDHRLLSQLASSSVQIEPPLADLMLDMQELATTDMAALLGKLQPLIDVYCSCINAHEAQLGDAVPVLQQCRKTLAYVQAGVNLLAHHQGAARAFSFMNRAMWLQRIHLLYAEEKQQNSAVTIFDVQKRANHRWRPLQLAFLLLNLPALTDVASHHHRHARPAANLPWFRAGEGKMEACLGLTTYTLALRRLQHTHRKSHEGPAVIMCYPPRYFALQQFRQVSALIGACEVMRNVESSVWGTHPFQLGLWDGLYPSASSSDEATKIVRSGRRFASVSGPTLLSWCPWCGSRITWDKISNGQGRSRTFIHCSDPFHQCPFSKPLARGEGLACMVDETMHQHSLPSLLVAATDEVAHLPWEGGTRIFFA